MFAQSRCGQLRIVAHHNISDEAPLADLIFARNHYARSHVAMRIERGYDLQRLDAVSPNLDLSSSRPRNSISPFGKKRARSPVRYIRSPSGGTRTSPPSVWLGFGNPSPELHRRCRV